MAKPEEAPLPLPGIPVLYLGAGRHDAMMASIKKAFCAGAGGLLIDSQGHLTQSLAVFAGDRLILPGKRLYNPLQGLSVESISSVIHAEASHSAFCSNSLSRLVAFVYNGIHAAMGSVTPGLLALCIADRDAMCGLARYAAFLLEHEGHVMAYANLPTNTPEPWDSEDGSDKEVLSAFRVADRLKNHPAQALVHTENPWASEPLSPFFHRSMPCIQRNIWFAKYPPDLYPSLQADGVHMILIDAARAAELRSFATQLDAVWSQGGGKYGQIISDLLKWEYTETSPYFPSIVEEHDAAERMIDPIAEAAAGRWLAVKPPLFGALAKAAFMGSIGVLAIDGYERYAATADLKRLQSNRMAVVAGVDKVGRLPAYAKDAFRIMALCATTSGEEAFAMSALTRNRVDTVKILSQPVGEYIML